jgi:hypothetical protein
MKGPEWVGMAGQWTTHGQPSHGHVRVIVDFDSSDLDPRTIALETVPLRECVKGLRHQRGRALSVEACSRRLCEDALVSSRDTSTSLRRSGRLQEAFAYAAGVGLAALSRESLVISLGVVSSQRPPRGANDRK